MERSRRGKRYAAQAGSVTVLSGAPPYGYHYISKQDRGGQARYEVIPEEARIVRQVFTWASVERITLYQICRRLEASGERTRTGKTNWNSSTIHGILKNPAYKGTDAYGKTRNEPMRPRLHPYRGHPLQPRRPKSVNHVPTEKWVPIPVPALVDEALFDIVQQQLKDNRRLAR